MDGLRWLLLVFGLIVIAGVYIYTRYQRKKAQDSPQRDLFEGKAKPTRAKSVSGVRRVEPVLSMEDDEPDPEEKEDTEQPEPPPEQKIVALRIVARDSGAFAGDELVLSLRGIGMRHGKFGIFHRYDGSSENNTIFSAASLVEPGSFDMTNIKEQKLPGISLFLILPGPVEGAEAFDMMMTAARAVAQALNGELLDESGSTLSIQRERYMREEVIQFEHSIKVA